MTNEERLAFLKEKPSYICRFHPTEAFHELGCPHIEYSKEDLQKALDQAKRSLELQVHLLNEKL